MIRRIGHPICMEGVGILKPGSLHLDACQGWMTPYGFRHSPRSTATGIWQILLRLNHYIHINDDSANTYQVN
jgi:hypothetical protein